jgi:hypothetical protein
MVGPYGQPLGSGPLGRVFRAGALTLKRGAQPPAFAAYRAASVFPLTATKKSFLPLLSYLSNAALLDVGEYELGPTGFLIRQLVV